MAVNVLKVFGALEDLLFGIGTISQTRGGVTGDYTRINASHIPTLLGFGYNGSVEDALVDRYTKAVIDAGYATLGGLNTQLFLVANGTTGYEAVNFSQLDLKADASTAALKSNVLELDNSDSYTPTFDYNPATKKFVVDLVGKPTALFTGTFPTNDGRLVTVTGGYIESVV